jgi:hypothetical protein
LQDSGYQDTDEWIIVYEENAWHSVELCYHDSPMLPQSFYFLH